MWRDHQRQFSYAGKIKCEKNENAWWDQQCIISYVGSLQYKTYVKVCEGTSDTTLTAD